MFDLPETIPVLVTVDITQLSSELVPLNAHRATCVVRVSSTGTETVNNIVETMTVEVVMTEVAVSVGTWQSDILNADYDECVVEVTKYEVRSLENLKMRDEI